MTKVTMADYLLDTDRYELRPGSEEDAPSCPFGNRYEWIGYDLLKNEYVRFTTSVFKKLIKEIKSNNQLNGM